jgi:hypothetical protein
MEKARFPQGVRAFPPPPCFQHLYLHHVLNEGMSLHARPLHAHRLSGETVGQLLTMPADRGPSPPHTVWKLWPCAQRCCWIWHPIICMDAELELGLSPQICSRLDLCK